MRYLFLKIISKVLRWNDSKLCDKVNDFFRKKGMKIGNDCRIYSNIGKGEAFLIEIGNNVTISNDVQIITHDNSVIKVFDNGTDYFGKVIIEDNCFIGARAILLPGVTIGRNSIVGAGSVVCKSVKENCVVGGNPAKIICTIEEFANKVSPFVIDLNSIQKTGLSLNDAIKQNENILIKK